MHQILYTRLVRIRGMSTKFQEKSITLLLLGILYSPNTVQQISIRVMSTNFKLPRKICYRIITRHFVCTKYYTVQQISIRGMSTKFREKSITVLLLGILYSPNTVLVQQICIRVMSTKFRETSITVCLLGILYAQNTV
jgi:hypothetical protein